MLLLGIVGLISVLCGISVLLDGKRLWTGFAVVAFGFALLFTYAANA